MSKGPKLWRGAPNPVKGGGSLAEALASYPVIFSAKIAAKRCWSPLSLRVDHLQETPFCGFSTEYCPTTGG